MCLPIRLRSILSCDTFLAAVIGIALILVLVHIPSIVRADTGAAIPPQAVAVGYRTQTFSGPFSKQTVDLENTGRPGFNWYPWRFFGQAPPPPQSVAFTADGSIILGTESLDSNLATAAPTRNASRWVGLAFGGGAYFEAILQFDPAKTAQGKPKAWPSFWSLSIEHAAGLSGEQWPGQQTGYVHFIEPDFFEYDVWSFAPRSYYGGAIHDWYGIFRATCPGKAFCGVTNAGGGGTAFTNFKIQTTTATDFTKPHKFGLLWVPATPTTKGYAEYYFDGKATADRVTWDIYANQPPPPGLAPWTFGIVDRQHLVLIISTGINQPLTVASVSVWQSSVNKNLRQ